MTTKKPTKKLAKTADPFGRHTEAFLRDEYYGIRNTSTRRVLAQVRYLQVALINEGVLDEQCHDTDISRARDGGVTVRFTKPRQPRGA